MAELVNSTSNEPYPPNYWNKEDHGRYLIAVSSVMILLTTISITLRFLSRHLSRKVTYWWDDWCALAAWVLLMPQYGILIDSVHYGVGRHQGTLSQAQEDRIALDIFIGEVFYNTGLTATKFSALFFYMRVFPWTHRWFRWSLYIAFGLCAGWCIAITFLGSFQCAPAKAYWEPQYQHHCLSKYGVNLGTSIPNVLIDLFILAIPMPFIRNLQVGLKQKVGVAVVFFAGYAVLALSITRVVVTAELKGMKLKDYSWNSLTFLEVVDLEPGIGLISVCLPAQVYLFRFVLSEFFGVCWSSISQSMMTSKNNLKSRTKRSSEKVRSMIESSRNWRNLSNTSTNTSYQASVCADLTASTQSSQENIEGIQGIQVRTDVTVRSSWAPQFVQLILG